MVSGSIGVRACWVAPPETATDSPTMNLSTITLTRLSIALLGLLALGATLLSGRAPEEPVSPSAANVVGPRRCAECHEDENRTWLETHHHQSYKTLARTPEARAMTKALGIRRLKREDRCIRCHFTEQWTEDNKSKVIAGVSCESCHGAGKNWLDGHGSYGGEGKTRLNEEPDHRDARLADAFEAGMRGPKHLYELAARCYECHLIVDEELQAAGHGVGAGFELSTAMQGKVRHNFVRGAGQNVTASAERLRILYLLGRLLEVQFTFDALSALESESSVAAVVIERACLARDDLIEAAERLPLPAFEELLAILPAEAELTPGHASLQTSVQAAERTARWLTMEGDGAQFVSLDELVRDAASKAKR